MSTYRKLLKDRDGNTIIPIVNTESVVDSNGNTVDALLASKQETLVSGTNIKTINSGSLLGSGNIDAQTPLVFTTTTIPAASWSNLRATVTVSGVTANNHVICSPAPDYMSSTVYAYSQTTDSITFACTTTPSAAVTMNIFIVN